MKTKMIAATAALGLLAVPASAMADNPNPDCTGNPHLCAEGTPGPVGPAGPEGPAGPAGADGQDGQNGIDGQDGVDGQDGLDGAAGRDGVNGTNGVNGADGQNGTTTVITREVQAPKAYAGQTLRVLTIAKHGGKRISVRATMRGKALAVTGNHVLVDLRGQAVGNYNVRIVAKYRDAHGKVHVHVTTRHLSVALA